MPSPITTADAAGQLGRLVVIPSESLEDYRRVGMGWFLESYYNPARTFREVYTLCREGPACRSDGMTVLCGSLRRLARLLRELRPDVVRAYGGYWAADFACRHRLAGVPVVVSVHDPHPRMVHRSVACADLVLCTSSAVEQAVLDRGADPARLRRLPNRVDLSVFQPVQDPARLGRLTERFGPGRYILHVGRKAPEKNLPAVIEALACLEDDYKAVFVGQGNPRPFQELARRRGVDRRCFWVESVPNEELPAWYSWCACMCTPSLWEGFGIVFIEAAACGSAIVTSDIAPMNEYLAHGASACLVKDYRDGEALATAIRRVCQDADFRRTIRQGAQAAVRPFERAAVDTLESGYYRQAAALGPRPVPWQRRWAMALDCRRRQTLAAARYPLRWVRRARHRLQPAASPAGTCRPRGTEPQPTTRVHQ